ncbi:MAG: aminoacyl-histidine dipeptidase [Bacteroidota bacterium]
MANVFDGLKPEKVWQYFYDICQIPHASKKEEKIIQYLLDFAAQHKLEAKKDGAGNVLICKAATAGMEKKKTIILQSHVDMVCEKNSDVQHDFDKDPIQPVIDNGWVKAKGTTLGADDGMGVAAALAILEANDIVHGPIECLFTVDEETGLTGAFALQPGFVKGTILLNLDSEDEGELFIGCAGGKGTIMEMPFKRDKAPAGKTYKISVTGLKGGHSGGDIHVGLGNAVKIINRLLWNAANNEGLRLSEIAGGNLHNAIAREAFATVVIPQDKAAAFEAYVKKFNQDVKDELASVDPGLQVACTVIENIETVIDADTQKKLLNSLYACPHGVIAMSADMPGLVETSTNLASVKIDGDKIIIGTSQRSSIESAKNDIADMVAAVFRLTGSEIKVGDGYPGWKPNVKSEILKITSESYKRLFGKEPKVLAIHAGLECGIIGEKNPGMDMISFGPTLRDVHCPDERIEIVTVDMFWKHLIDVLKSAPDA